MHMKKKRKLISSEEFDRIFDEGKEDIMQYVDPTSIRQPGLESKRMNDGRAQPRSRPPRHRPSGLGQNMAGRAVGEVGDYNILLTNIE